MGDIANINNEIVEQKTTILSEEQLQKYDRLLCTVDRNMNLDGSKANHNTDFCLIRSKSGQQNIEPTRDFCLKAVSVFELNYEVVGEPTIYEKGNDTYVSRDVKVSIGDRYIIESGGCSTKETSSSGSRAFHDALAKSVTRAMKRGLEALVGLPFVNMMIKEAFGTYQVDAKDVTPTTAKKTENTGNVSQQNRVIVNEIKAMLKDAKDDLLITKEEGTKYWNMTMKQVHDFRALNGIKDTVTKFIQERKSE